MEILLGHLHCRHLPHSAYPFNRLRRTHVHQVQRRLHALYGQDLRREYDLDYG